MQHGEEKNRLLKFLTIRNIDFEKNRIVAFSKETHTNFKETTLEIPSSSMVIP